MYIYIYVYTYMSLAIKQVLTLLESSCPCCLIRDKHWRTLLLFIEHEKR